MRKYLRTLPISIPENLAQERIFQCNKNLKIQQSSLNMNQHSKMVDSPHFAKRTHFAKRAECGKALDCGGKRSATPLWDVEASRI